MAAKKKSKPKSKKKAVRKKAAKTASPKKKSTAKKKVAGKKKTAAKKKVSATGKKKSLAKKRASKKVSGNKSVSNKTSDVPVKKPSPAKQKLSTGKSKKIGSRVRTLTGRVKGESGVIVRQDACLGTFFILLDRMQNNPFYKNIEWGPYFESQLEFVRKR